MGKKNKNFIGGPTYDRPHREYRPPGIQWSEMNDLVLEDVVDDAISDIETVLDWYQSSDPSIVHLHQIMGLGWYPKTKNVVHGLNILEKLAVMKLEMTPAQMVGVLLHDVVKYKSRYDIITKIQEYMMGEGRYARIEDHGVNAAIGIAYKFKIPIDELHFVLMHAKKHPMDLDPDNMSIFEMAFWLIDELIRDTHRYKIKLGKSEFAELNNFIRSPQRSNIRRVFDHVRSCRSDNQPN